MFCFKVIQNPKLHFKVLLLVIKHFLKAKHTQREPPRLETDRSHVILVMLFPKNSIKSRQKKIHTYFLDFLFTIIFNLWLAVPLLCKIYMLNMVDGKLVRAIHAKADRNMGDFTARAVKMQLQFTKPHNCHISASSLQRCSCTH